jgi:anti-sigma factor RsiW
VTHLDELLSAYLDGELFEHERSTVAAHLNGCDRCRQELLDVAAARSAVRSLPTLELPLVELGLPVVVPLRRRPAVWVGAAAAAVSIVIGAAMAATPAPQTVTPPDLSQVFLARSTTDPGQVPVNAAGVALVSAGGGNR